MPEEPITDELSPEEEASAGIRTAVFRWDDGAYMIRFEVCDAVLVISRRQAQELSDKLDRAIAQLDLMKTLELKHLRAARREAPL